LQARWDDLFGNTNQARIDINVVNGEDGQGTVAPSDATTTSGRVSTRRKKYKCTSDV
jgi:hypothetical protein